MVRHCGRGNGDCQFYDPSYIVEFKIVERLEGEHFYASTSDSHRLAFILEGELEVSYNEFLNRRFVKGDLFFIPHAAELYSTALKHVRMFVLRFNNCVETLCEQCRLSKYAKKELIISYDFHPLKITDTIYGYLSLMEGYLGGKIQCKYLHKLKQKELFILLGIEYTDMELSELLYPISGGDVNFRSKVMANYRNGIKVTELAQKFGMSYSSFLRHFKTEFDESVQEWMLKQKAKHIMLRLSIPSVTVSDILREFDFSDLSHFIRFCHKYYGCTPQNLLKSIRVNAVGWL